VRSSRWKTGPSKGGSARLVAHVCVAPGDSGPRSVYRAICNTDLKIALPALEEDQRREARLRPYRLWRETGLHRPSHRRISGRRPIAATMLRPGRSRDARPTSSRRVACRHRRTRRFGLWLRRDAAEPARPAFDCASVAAVIITAVRGLISSTGPELVGGLRGHGHGLC